MNIEQGQNVSDSSFSLLLILAYSL